MWENATDKLTLVPLYKSIKRSFNAMETSFVGGPKADYVRWIDPQNKIYYGKLLHFFSIGFTTNDGLKHLMFAKMIPMKESQSNDELDMFHFFKDLKIPEAVKPVLFEETELDQAFYIPAHFITESVQMNHNCSNGCVYSHQMIDKEPVVMKIHHNKTKQFILNTIT